MQISDYPTKEAMRIYKKYKVRMSIMRMWPVWDRLIYNICEPAVPYSCSYLDAAGIPGVAGKQTFPTQ